MICRLFSHIKGCFIAIAMLISWLFSSSAVVIAGCFVYLLTPSRLKPKAIAQLAHIGLWWAKSCHYLLLLGNRRKWRISSTDTLSKQDWYLLISNHRSWADILILNVAFGRSIPIFKYFLKKQLLWQLPIGGLSCWMLGFPFVPRYNKKQVRKNPKLMKKAATDLKKACAKFHLCPTTAIIFPEGTRYTSEKHSKQQSPYTHLLKPKTQGMAMVINTLPKKLNTLLNVTINHKPTQLSLWSILCGNYDHIDVTLQTHAITDAQRGDFEGDRHYRKALQEWVNHIWAEKDSHLAKAGIDD